MVTFLIKMPLQRDPENGNFPFGLAKTAPPPAKGYPKNTDTPIIYGPN